MATREVLDTELFGLDVVGAGSILGVDAALEQFELVQNNRWLRYLVG